MPSFLKRQEEAILGAAVSGFGVVGVVLDDEGTLKMKCIF
jgi:hypothetical protein